MSADLNNPLCRHSGHVVHHIGHVQLSAEVQAGHVLRTEVGRPSLIRQQI